MNHYTRYAIYSRYRRHSPMPARLLELTELVAAIAGCGVAVVAGLALVDLGVAAHRATRQCRRNHEIRSRLSRSIQNGRLGDIAEKDIG